jgi:hemoglobin/transferrin/lactoferrin receptor protein
MVTATLGARFFDEALTVGTRVTHATARKIPPSPIDVSTAVVWAPFTVVDLFASYKLNENLTFNVSAENLADKFYVDPLGGTPIAAPGRTIHVGFTAKF